MRNTSSDMMEDAMSEVSEDTMMDCGVDTEDMEAFGDLATDISNSTSTIRDAAERLLTLFGVDEWDEDYSSSSSSSSSEDEGVEVDLDENYNEDDENELRNTRLLHQLTMTLAEELKQTQLQNNNNIITKNCEQIQRMDITYSDDAYRLLHGQSSVTGNKFDKNRYDNFHHVDNSQANEEITHRILDNQVNSTHDCSDIFVSNKRCKLDLYHHIIHEHNDKSVEESKIPSLWTAGWDFCATEAVKYLINIEGLNPSHPTVLALKSHLDTQKNPACVQYTT